MKTRISNLGIALLVPIALCGCEAKVRLHVESNPSTNAPIEQPKIVARTLEPEVKPKRTNMPPGFTMVCDVSKGVYSATWGEGMVWAFDPICSNQQQVIDRAWTTYEYKQKPQTPSPSFGDFNWSMCK